jgi:hypothetical protein
MQSQSDQVIGQLDLSRLDVWRRLTGHELHRGDLGLHPARGQRRRDDQDETPAPEARGGSVRMLVLLCLHALLAACGSLQSSPRADTIQRAIEARGGPIRSMVRWFEADVRMQVPGIWQGRIVFVAPDRYALTIVTMGETNHHIYDGARVRSFIGNHLVATQDSRAPLVSQAKFEAAVNLDALLDPAVRVESLPATALPPGVVTGVEVIPSPDGNRYRLGFDRRMLLVWAAGPLDFSPFGRGEIEVTFDDFRLFGGLQLPVHATYTAGGSVLLDQRMQQICPNKADASDAWFASPTDLPACGIQ